MEAITQLTRSDYEDVFKLSQFAFQYTLSEAELVKKAREADRHDIWGYKVDGELAGKLHIIPLEVMIHGQKFTMGGISSVATWPEYGRLGIAKNLLHHALIQMKEKDQVLAYLHPFLASFYRKYGWEYTFNRRMDTIPISQFKRKWNGQGTVKRAEAKVSLLNDIYSVYSNRYNGMLVRDELWWQQCVLTDQSMHVVYAYNEADHAEGYMIYKVEDNELIVKEFAYKDVNALYLLYDFIGNHDSMAVHVKWKVAPNNLLPLLASDPNYEQIEQPYFMARIVQIEAFLQQYKFTKHAGSLALFVEDEFLPDNTGIYEMKVEDGMASSLTKVKDTDSIAVYSSIQYVTAMFLGYKRPKELYEAGLITGSEEAINHLEVMIPVKQPYFQDFF